MADSQQRFIAHSLLARLPEQERTEAVLEAVRSLKKDHASSGASFAVSLLAEHPNEDARRELLQHLFESLEQGRFAHVDSLCANDTSLKYGLLKQTVQTLYDAAFELAQTKSSSIVVPLKDVLKETPVGSAPTEDDERPATQNLLRFAKSAIDAKEGKETADLLLCSALFYLGSAERQTCLLARSTLVALSSNTSVDHTLVWGCVKNLIAYQHDSFYPNLGYGIWLRWAAGEASTLKSWFEPQYWDLLQRGLSLGDTECRKQCLGILRQSVVIAADDDATRSMVCSKDDANIEGSTLSNQYDRFLTVFETIVLGRYINQVLACEDDLNFLASQKSLVQSKWLYTLLSTVLGPKMQDSNKKFIGNWMMRSNFQPDSSEGFLHFFNESFLPWMTQGSLFTSSLKKADGELRCRHGERVSNYIMELLQRNMTHPDVETRLVDSILEMLTNRRKGNFAYASVYLLDGIARGFEFTPDLAVNSQQLDKIVKLSSWADLPEVPRDFVLLRCLKLCHELSLRSPEAVIPTSMNAARQWQTVLRKCSQISPSRATKVGEPVASWDLQFSNRDVQEQETVQKFEVFRQKVIAKSDSMDDINEMLNDIWSDMEYLEFPKRLVIEMPDLALDPQLVRLALEYEPLSTSIASIVRYLQTMSATKLYIFAPLILAIRTTILTAPEAVQSLSMEEVILDLASQLPEATVDMKLEDVTTRLIQSIAPEMKPFDYKYYLGDRESLGFATLLDLVSRLHAEHFDLSKAILNKLVDRWLAQKVPTPTVSPWKSTLQVQIMLVCCEQVVPRATAEEASKLLKDLHYILSIEPLPRYRYLLSWMLARVYLKCPDEKSAMLQHLSSTDHHSNPKYLSALMKIAVMLACADGCDVEFANQLASRCVPLAASSKVVIRHESQWQVPILMDHAKSKGWSEVVNNAAFVALDEYIRSLDRFDDPPLERQLDRFDPTEDHTLAILTEGNWFGLDDIENSLCGRADFAELYKRDEQSPSPFAASCMPLGGPVIPITQSSKDPTTADDTTALVPGIASESRALQTKGTAYLTSALDNDTDTATPTRPHHDLIVIGSLVDNPYNLGGLSRISEIFGAASLHLQNQNVVSSRDFTGVAVSSHLHFPICQLSAPALPAFLAEKRDTEGFTIVGIEQTDRSLILGSKECVLPRKVVLVVGSEKEGIPAAVLSECDLLVEIPQMGITRSLNVQTAAGIVMFEYTRQWRGK